MKALRPVMSEDPNSAFCGRNDDQGIVPGWEVAFNNYVVDPLQGDDPLI